MGKIIWSVSTRWRTGFSGQHPASKRLTIEVYWDLGAWCYQITLTPIQQKEEPLCRGMEDTQGAAKQACEDFLNKRLEGILKQFNPGSV